MEETLMKKERIRLLDGLRGIAILLMVLHHALFDITYSFFDHSAFAVFCGKVCESPILEYGLEPLFRCLFVFLSGVACRFSRNNYRRGTITFLIGLGLEVLTCVVLPWFDPNMFANCEIRFGILSCLGACMILWGLLGDAFDRLADKKFAKGTLPVALLLLFIVFYVFSEGYYDVEGLYWLGFASHTFYSADWFPLLPWLFMFFLGAYYGRPIRDRKWPAWFYKAKLPFFDTVGRYTLWIYLLHQPVVFGLCYLIFEFLPRL